MNINRSAAWALLGVVIGFGLPVLACIGLTFVLSLVLVVLGSQAAPPARYQVHVSGPLTGPAVVLIDITGPIVSGETSPFDTTPLAASGDLIPLIREAAEDPEVKALVLRVDSPGGSVVPSDEVYHALKETDKPIVVLMGDVAASGGYYISMAASYVVANPNTLTGSIGVISLFPDAHVLLEKVGVQFNVIKSGQVKDIGSPWRPMNEQEKRLWQEIVNETYDGFVAIVVEGRNLPEEKVRALADGRIFTGRQALDLGLVDALGYEEDAIARAAALGGIRGEPRVFRYEKPRTLMTLLGERMPSLGLLPPDLLRRILAPTLEFRWVP
jgi:protease-4